MRFFKRLGLAIGFMEEIWEALPPTGLLLLEDNTWFLLESDSTYIQLEG